MSGGPVGSNSKGSWRLPTGSRSGDARYPAKVTRPQPRRQQALAREMGAADVFQAVRLHDRPADGPRSAPVPLTCKIRVTFVSRHFGKWSEHWHCGRDRSPGAPFLFGKWPCALTDISGAHSTCALIYDLATRATGAKSGAASAPPGTTTNRDGQCFQRVPLLRASAARFRSAWHQPRAGCSAQLGCTRPLPG